MKRLVLALVAAAWLGLGAGAMAWAADEKLTVVQDESSMEQVIERYLKANHKLIINEKNDAGDDVVLELPMKGEPMPGYRISIDTQSLNRDDDKKVIERGVRVQLFTGIKVPEAKLDAALKIVNDFNRRKVFCAAYVDTDGEVVLDWTLNVLSDGLATEYVYDAVAREDKLWKELYAPIAAALK